jgi:hypothetical protein
MEHFYQTSIKVVAKILEEKEERMSVMRKTLKIALILNRFFSPCDYLFAYNNDQVPLL